MVMADNKPSHIDEVLADLRKTSAGEIDDAFKAYDEYDKPETANHINLEILKPGQDTMYAKVSDEIQGSVGKNEEKLKGKKAEVKSALREGLREYFDKVMPSVNKTMDNLGLSEDDQYKFLTKMYDDHIGVGQLKDAKSIKNLEALADSDDTTVGHLRMQMAQRIGDTQLAKQMIDSKHFQHYFSNHDAHVVAAHLQPQFEEAGYEIKNKLAYATADHGTLLDMRKSKLKGEDHPLLKKSE